MALHLKLLDVDHPLTFEESKLRQIEAHALIYLSYRIVHFTGSRDHKLYQFPPFAVDDHGFHCTPLVSCSQNPRGTSFPGKKIKRFSIRAKRVEVAKKMATSSLTKTMNRRSKMAVCLFLYKKDKSGFFRH